jgi:Fungal domain of unknown function (DUF1746)
LLYVPYFFKPKNLTSVHSNSSLLLALRTITQLYISKNDPSSVLASSLQPYAGWIFGSNLLCTLSHVISPSPIGGGYLNGHLIIDFIGQTGPTSKLPLLIIDALIFLLQLLLLSVLVKRVSLIKWDVRLQREGDPSGSDPLPTQTHDAEERGILEDDLICLNSISPIPLANQHDQLRGQQDRLYSALFFLDTFWLIDFSKLRDRKSSTFYSTGASSSLSSFISRDVRQSRPRYALSIPFRS